MSRTRTNVRGLPTLRMGMITLVVLVLSISLAACGSDSGGGASSDEVAAAKEKLPAELQDLYEAAAKEGSVNYWTSDDPPVIAEVMKAFNKTYPGIKVEPTLIQPEEAVDKIISESSSGNPPDADVILLGVPTAVPLMERDLAATVDWSKYGLAADQTLFDNRGVKFVNYTLAIAFNPDAIDRKDVPTTLEGLADSPLLDKGRLAIESRGWAFGLMAQEIGQEKSLALLDRLLAKKPLIVKGAGPIGDAVSTGEADVAFTLLTSSALEMMAGGANVDYVNPDPILCTNFQNVVTKESEHPNAAKLLTLWLNSPDAIKAYQAQNLFPERLTGDFIPDYSQKMLDTGSPIVCDNEDDVELAVETNTKAAERMAGLG